MADLAFLEYTFLFDPLDTWQSLSQFEGQFADFLATRGLEARYLNSVDPKTGRRICMIIAQQKIDLLRKAPKNDLAPAEMGNSTMRMKLRYIRSKKHYEKGKV